LFSDSGCADILYLGQAVVDEGTNCATSREKRATTCQPHAMWLSLFLCVLQWLSHVGSTSKVVAVPMPGVVLLPSSTSALNRSSISAPAVPWRTRIHIIMEILCMMVNVFRFLFTALCGWMSVSGLWLLIMRVVHCRGYNCAFLLRKLLAWWYHLLFTHEKMLHKCRYKLS